jgi:hypothetical protein
MDSLKTPLLLEEGDVDGNVNPFQSQEVYNFGRRLGKNVVYLVYEDENHGVARPESQRDYHTRQLEWFAHYLKGEPAADWITNGETYAQRQKLLRDATAQRPMLAVRCRREHWWAGRSSAAVISKPVSEMVSDMISEPSPTPSPATPEFAG